ncbi:hypothetical protein ANCDUO_12745 [Ancylostoma duodenale]|uniref:Uncharacterized protein n=1 Tax=Ancylostoma duodenale TaxID=51022 RepID=A0A0C2CKP1_9BILA|nr:hypothetical protein ANCDUO_12745 [Ancylostoma duodenale]
MSLASGILLYKGYIHDGYVMDTTEMEVEATLKRLNAFDLQVSFTVERPNGKGFLLFLSSNQREHVWYRKTVVFNIFVHARSALPQFIKTNVVPNLIRTKNKLCSRTDPEVEETDLFSFRPGVLHRHWSKPTHEYNGLLQLWAEIIQNL